MTLGELREFVNRLPVELDEFFVMNGEVGYIEPDNEESAVYRVDKPVIALYVDEKENEIVFFHQTREDLKTILPYDTEQP